MTGTLRPLAALAMVALVAVISAGCGGTDSSSGTGNAGTSSSVGTGGNKNVTARDKAVRFSECMRANGVSAFPDPNASGELTIDAVANGSSLDTSTAAFEQAMSACKDLEPPGFTGHERTAQEQEAALEFAQCIRDHGVKDFPDPAIDEPLVDTYRIPSSATPGGMAILNAAMQKCDASAAGVTGAVMPKHRVLAGAAVELCPEGTLGREPVSTQSADKGRNHEENAAASGRPCHARRDQRGLFERICRQQQHRHHEQHRHRQELRQQQHRRQSQQHHYSP